MEFMIYLGVIVLMGCITYVLSKDGDAVFFIIIITGFFGGLLYLAIGSSLEVDPTITQIPIDNIQIVENGYVIEYGDTKKFLDKDEVTVEISDKNVLVENKYEYSKVENQFPYNITPSNSDSVMYKLLIKSDK